MKNDRLIHVEKLLENLYCLKEVESVNRYLIIGAEKALLFDTGYGYMDFREQLTSITSLPLYVVNSHGDPDHALGSYLFEQVYMHSGDYEFLMNLDQNSAEKKATIDYRLTKLPGLAQAMDINSYILPNLGKTEFVFLSDGDNFQLGGLTLDVIHIPGHSMGSIALFCRETGWLFTSDSIAYYNIFYQGGLGHHAPFRTYLHSLKRLQAMAEDVTALYPAHGQKPIPVSAIQETIDGIYHLSRHYEEDSSRLTMIGEAFWHRFKHIEILYGKDVLWDMLANGLDE